MRVIIMQGISGSGKSTWVRSHRMRYSQEKSVVVSADLELVEMGDGVYIWNLHRAVEAHRRALSKFLDHLRDESIDTIYVDNTNLKPMDVATYYRTAEAAGADVVIVQLWIDVALAKRSKHVTPDKSWVLENQFDQLEKLKMPRHWHIMKSNAITTEEQAC